MQSARARGLVASRPRVRVGTLAALLIGISIMVVGNGLQGTLLAVRGSGEGFGQGVIGIFQSAYYAGFAAGCLLGAPLIQRAGHINCFAAFASLASIATLAHALLVDPVVWIGLRALNGACYAGLVIVTESWLNASAAPETRGRVLALYIVATMGAAALGQSLLLVADPGGFRLFALVSILISASLVPIVLSRARVPAEIVKLRLKFSRLYAVSPLAVVGCFAIGAISSGFFGLGGAFGAALGLGKGGIAAFMSLTLIGGLALQWPVGYVADRLDRRWIILGQAVITALIAAAVATVTARGGGVMLYPLAFLFGAALIPAYSVCVALANDRIEPEELVTVASGLVLVYALGSLFGPLIAGPLMAALGPAALYGYMAVASALLALWAGLRMSRREAVPVAEQAPFVPAPRTTPAAAELDPRAPPVEVVQESREAGPT